MPSCPKCGTLLSEKMDQCPNCHYVLKTTKGATKVDDFTDAYNPVDSSLELIRIKSRKVAAILSFIIGFLGIAWIYLGYYKKAFYTFLLSLVTITPVAIFFSTYLYIPIILVIIVQIINGFHILFSPTLKDGHGEWLR